MKSTSIKIKKPQGPDATRSLKSRCGTLNYLAECRGCLKKAGPVKWQAQSVDLNGIVRKYPAV